MVLFVAGSMKWGKSTFLGNGRDVTGRVWGMSAVTSGELTIDKNSHGKEKLRPGKLRGQWVRIGGIRLKWRL